LLASAQGPLACQIRGWLVFAQHSWVALVGGGGPKLNDAGMSAVNCAQPAGADPSAPRPPPRAHPCDFPLPSAVI